MKVLLLGSGGREHAMAWKIAQSPRVKKLYIAPGNAGTATVGENVNIKATDFEALKVFALEREVNMIVVGPEDPLVQGIFDFFKGDIALQHIAIIGPSMKGAQLEGSKELPKDSWNVITSLRPVIKVLLQKRLKKDSSFWKH